jgi:hypothetical protein
MGLREQGQNMIVIQGGPHDGSILDVPPDMTFIVLEYTSEHGERSAFYEFSGRHMPDGRQIWVPEVVPEVMH